MSENTSDALLTDRSSKSRKIKDLDITKDELLQDDINRDKLLEHGQQAIKKEMDEASNALYNAYNFETKTHKDPNDEAKRYLSKQDVYDIFKSVTMKLVLDKPNDPIACMINQLRCIQAEKKLEQEEQQKGNNFK